MKKMNKKIFSLVVIFTIVSLLMTGLVPLKAYASNSSNPFDTFEQVKDDISEAFSEMDTETAESVFAFLKDKVQSGALKSEENMQKAISEGKEKFGVEMNQEDAKQLVETMDKLESMGFSAEFIINKSEELYQKYGADFVDHTEEIIASTVTDTVTNAVGKFFTGIIDGIGSFFKDFFS